MMEKTTMDDLKIMESALEGFQTKARSKFIQGIKEHNSDGKHGLSRMKSKERIQESMNEVIDLWFYLFTELMTIEREERFDRESLRDEYHDEIHEAKERREDGYGFRDE